MNHLSSHSDSFRFLTPHLRYRLIRPFGFDFPRVFLVHPIRAARPILIAYLEAAYLTPLFTASRVYHALYTSLYKSRFFFFSVFLVGLAQTLCFK